MSFSSLLVFVGRHSTPFLAEASNSATSDDLLAEAHILNALKRHIAQEGMNSLLFLFVIAG
jgi:hypothetical protein